VVFSIYYNIYTMTILYILYWYTNLKLRNSYSATVQPNIFYFSSHHIAEPNNRRCFKHRMIQKIINNNIVHKSLYAIYSVILYMSGRVDIDFVKRLQKIIHIVNNTFLIWDIWMIISFLSSSRNRLHEKRIFTQFNAYT